MVSSLLTVGQQIIILFLLMAVGFCLGKTHMIDERGSVAMSNVAMYGSIPAMLIVSFQRELVVSDLRDFGMIALLTAFSIGLTIVMATLLLRKGELSRRQVLRFASVFSNSGFMGYPLMFAILGTTGVFFGSAYVAIFQFFVWTWGVYCMTGDRKRMKLRPILLSPGIIGVVIAMALYLLKITLPDIIFTPIQHLANMNTPLPMVVVGYQLSHADLKGALRGADAWLCALLRMVAAPLIVLGICLLLRTNATVTTVLVIAASAPPAAITSMFAAKFGGNTALASSVVSLHTLFSIVTMPLIIALAQSLV